MAVGTFGNITGERLRGNMLMNRITGKTMSDTDNLVQSIADILTTRLGTRVERRDYGSNIFDLIDAPITPALMVQMMAAVATPLKKWEPRLILTNTQVNLVDWNNGVLSITLTGYYLLTGRPIRLADISLDFLKFNNYDLAIPDYKLELLAA